MPLVGGQLYPLKPQAFHKSEIRYRDGPPPLLKRAIINGIPRLLGLGDNRPGKPPEKLPVFGNHMHSPIPPPPPEGLDFIAIGV
jgi:hypothetical protein